MKNNKIMLSCKQATALVERNTVSKLTFNETIKMKLHLLMCKVCSSYQKQSLFIHKILEKKFKLENSGDSSTIEVIKNDALKERIFFKL